MTQEANPNEAKLNDLQTRFETLSSSATLRDISQAVSKLTDDIVSCRKKPRMFVSVAITSRRTWNTSRCWRSTGVKLARRRSVRLPMKQHGPRRSQPPTTPGGSGGFTESQPDAGGSTPGTGARVETVESMLETAHSRIEALYETLETDTAQALNQLRTINGLDQRDEPLPVSARRVAVFATKAEWLEGKDKPDGILYLTDQRLLFEQKETTGKKLGLFGGKKTQELEFNLPLHQITKVEPENKGFLGGKDMLNFTLGTGAPYTKLTVEVKGGVQSKFWAAQIQRMIAGETNDERAIQPDAETLEAIRNAPTACPSCGGTLPQLVANQRQVACAYCGSVIRV